MSKNEVSLVPVVLSSSYRPGPYSLPIMFSPRVAKYYTSKGQSMFQASKGTFCKSNASTWCIQKIDIIWNKLQSDGHNNDFLLTEIIQDNFPIKYFDAMVCSEIVNGERVLVVRDVREKGMRKLSAAPGNWVFDQRKTA